MFVVLPKMMMMTMKKLIIGRPFTNWICFRLLKSVWRFIDKSSYKARLVIQLFIIRDINLIHFSFFTFTTQMKLYGDYHWFALSSEGRTARTEHNQKTFFV